jgi:uncharacterized protein (DUF1800 family)
MAEPEPAALEKLDPAHEWQVWKPTPADPWNAKWAGHLYRRAGFGATAAELREAVEKGLDAILDRLTQSGTAAKNARPVKNPTAAIPHLRAWWLERMLAGVEPLREKLTLFWHNHFATSINKVNDPKLMKAQNDLLRKHALGHFGPFLREMSRDAAMLIWLDSNENVKGKPNENYAREIMELFSLGVGNYKEKDIQEAARAFTGWHVTSADAGERRYVFRREEHDFGPKTILGQAGDWDGDDVVRILLEQPACAKFLVRKLYAFLVSESATPPDALLAPLADALRKNDYDLSVPVQMIIRSRHFFSDHAYRQRVKSPVEYAVGVGRTFGINAQGGMVVSPYSLVGAMELMGQQLFAPPNVKGWEGGKSWFNTATVLARHNFAQSVSQGMGELNQQAARMTGHGFLPAVDPLAIVRRDKIAEPEKVIRLYGEMLFPGDLRDDVARKLTAFVAEAKGEFAFEQRTRDALFVLMTLPEYQLC